ncbi:hypothetical protein CC86DRAFT_93699 [Ophiobolus disseminans]|uniref:Uncharacterized protein n=1 Tax=Ophiobolus disseminans TaxID=1469910 RepID=A0A6A6ZLI4_9PLEO|nr:hypothetical protein CC86DRAFT_93699 [Ophiobolus disseminans]
MCLHVLQRLEVGPQKSASPATVSTSPRRTPDKIDCDTTQASSSAHRAAVQASNSAPRRYSGHPTNPTTLGPRLQATSIVPV